MHLVGALLESRISVIDIYETCARAGESLLDSFKMHRGIPPSSSLAVRVCTLAHVFLTLARVFKIPAPMRSKKLKPNLHGPHVTSTKFERVLHLELYYVRAYRFFLPYR